MNPQLKDRGWEIVQAIAQDASARRYFRVAKGSNRAILMEMGEENERLADYIRIAGWLNSIGLKAPEIYEVDEAAGFALLEDLGEVSFKQALEQGLSAEEIYALANDVLLRMADAPPPGNLPAYFQSPIHAGHRRIVDWYLPLARGAKNADGLVESYMAAWAEVEKTLPPAPQRFVHADYHLENLVWRPDARGLHRAGILDFQEALSGPPAYDLCNLLWDARINVPAPVIQNLLAARDEQTRLWARVLATQFHCRVIGQFVKLALVSGKTHYLAHLPRLAAYIKEGIRDPALKPVALWLDENARGFENIPTVSAESRVLIRPDAV